MKAHIPPRSRVSKELLNIAAAEGLKRAHEIIDRESGDAMARAYNLCSLAMAMVGLSPRTGKRVKKRLEETVIPLWERYIQPDDGGKRDGDWAIRHMLEERGWPCYEPTEGEM